MGLGHGAAETAMDPETWRKGIAEAIAKLTKGTLEAGLEWAVMGVLLGGPIALGGKLITRAQVGGMVKRLAAKGISTEGMTPSQIVRRCWAEELKAVGKVKEGEMLEEMVGKEMEAADAGSLEAKVGKDPAGGDKKLEVAPSAEDGGQAGGLLEERLSQLENLSKEYEELIESEFGLEYKERLARLRDAAKNESSKDFETDLFLLELDLQHALSKSRGEKVVSLMTSSNSKRQRNIQKIAKWLGEMGKSNSQINRIIDGNIDLSYSASEFELVPGDIVYRFERTQNLPNADKHFFVMGDVSHAGVRSVGFSDPAGYVLVTYEVQKSTTVLRTTMNTKYIQCISGDLQFNIKEISVEIAH